MGDKDRTDVAAAAAEKKKKDAEQDDAFFKTDEEEEDSMSADSEPEVEVVAAARPKRKRPADTEDEGFKKPAIPVKKGPNKKTKSAPTKKEEPKKKKKTDPPPPKKRRVEKAASESDFSDLRELMHQQVDAAIDNADELVREAKLSDSRRKKLVAQYGSAKVKRDKRLKQIDIENTANNKRVADYTARCLARTAKPFAEYANRSAERDCLEDMTY